MSERLPAHGKHIGSGRRIYQIDGGYVISDNGTWLPGVYADVVAASRAFKFDPARLQELQDVANTRSVQNITLEDLTK